MAPVIIGGLQTKNGRAPKKVMPVRQRARYVPPGGDDEFFVGMVPRETNSLFLATARQSAFVVAGMRGKEIADIIAKKGAVPRIDRD
jgi:hypothetical protein